MSIRSARAATVGRSMGLESSFDTTSRGEHGDYRLFDEIGAGGMAVVHLGVREALPDSSERPRIVAIKRMREHFVSDPEFSSMFLDEITLCARIRHDNVVATLDVARDGEELWLVLEFIEGENLAVLARTVTSRKSRVSPRIASAILSDVLSGLHAAHEAVGQDGEPLMLVHRDVSPHNILVGIDGVARVLDFGIAKARGRVHQTQKGELKGKVAYMSPEHARGRPVDRRSDVFSAGVLLWELLVGRKLYDGENEAAVLVSLVGETARPPSSEDARLARYDELVMRALSHDPSARFATALEMREALRAAGPVASRSEVAAWVRTEAKAAVRARRALVEQIEALLERVASVRSAARSAQAPQTNDPLADSSTNDAAPPVAGAVELESPPPPEEDPLSATLAERSPFDDQPPPAMALRKPTSLGLGAPAESLAHLSHSAHSTGESARLGVVEPITAETWDTTTDGDEASSTLPLEHHAEARAAYELASARVAPDPEATEVRPTPSQSLADESSADTSDVPPSASPADTPWSTPATPPLATRDERDASGSIVAGSRPALSNERAMQLMIAAIVSATVGAVLAGIVVATTRMSRPRPERTSPGTGLRVDASAPSVGLVAPTTSSASAIPSMPSAAPSAEPTTTAAASVIEGGTIPRAEASAPSAARPPAYAVAPRPSSPARVPAKPTAKPTARPTSKPAAAPPKRPAR